MKGYYLISAGSYLTTLGKLHKTRERPHELISAIFLNNVKFYFDNFETLNIILIIVSAIKCVDFL